MERSLYVYRYVKRPFEEIVGLLENSPGAVLQPAMAQAQGQVDQFVARLHVDVGGFEVGRDVTVELGAREPMGAHTVVFPVDWKASESSAFFPALRGHLEVAAMSYHPPVSQVTFTGWYEPPLGFVGALADASVGKRIADAAVHHFVEEVVERLEGQLAEV